MDSLLHPFALTAGVISHLLYFNRGEHHMHGLLYLQTLLTVSILATVGVHKLLDHEFQHAIRLVASTEGSYLIGLYSSLVLWRLLTNPLNKIPGPLIARLSSFWWTFSIGTESHAFLRNQELHEKYGDFVRICPNTVSIAHPDGPNLLYGHGSKCRKADWYDSDAPLTSMHTSRDRQMHDKRRRLWSPAFSDKALRGYEQRIKPYADALVQRISEYKGQAVNVTQLFNFFGYDVMGDLAFGKDFAMLSSGKEHFAVQLLNEGMQPMANFPPVWFFRILIQIPGLAAGYHKFVKYCEQQMADRMHQKSEIQDLATPLLEPFKTREPQPLELSYLNADSRLVIVAGSDTTSATLAHVFNYLARDAALVEKARKELEPLLRDDGSFDNKEANNAQFVNGCINEALRLHPPVPTALQRLTPSEGLQVGNTYIPGDTCVWCPSYAMGHSENNYVDAGSFIPERWSTRPELIKAKNVFFPFSLGPMGCIGKPLALMELRTVMAKLLLTFDVSYAPGESGKDLVDKCRDHFTLEPGPLQLVFKARDI